MNRCELAIAYREKGFNCAQAVLASFGDLTHLPEKEALSVSGGFGGGIGGTHEEICGALSGAVIVLSLLYPHVEEYDAEGKRRIYGIIKELRKRFQEKFSETCCGDLLRTKIEIDDRLPAAKALGITNHCAVLIVSAVELVEEMLREADISC